MNAIGKVEKIIERTGLANALRDRTKDLHREAERSGIINDVLRGAGRRDAYAVFLRNLLPVYRQLEAGLEQHRHEPAVKGLARPEVYRSMALEADLVALHGPDWQAVLPLLDAGAAYVARVEHAARYDSALLIAHAYVRYLGDLNGGQVLKRLLSRSLDLTSSMLTFYEFPDIDDLTAFKAVYRDAFDAAGTNLSDTQSVLDEAADAFSLNIALSERVRSVASIDL